MKKPKNEQTCRVCRHFWGELCVAFSYEKDKGGIVILSPDRENRCREFERRETE